MNATYLALEAKRVVRSARFMIFTMVFPVVIYLIDASLFGSPRRDHDDGLAIAPSLMVRMAAFGAMSTALFTGTRVALVHSTAIGNAVLVLAVWSAVFVLVGAQRYRAGLAPA